MAWTTPMTWTDNSVLTAAQLNTHLRDNLLETMPGKISATSRMCVVDSNNKLVERNPGADTVNTLETCSSTEYGDLDTVGPTLIRTTGPTCLVMWRSQITPSAASSNDLGHVSVQVARTNSEPDSDGDDGTGEDATIEPNDRWALHNRFNNANLGQLSHYMMFHDLSGVDNENEAFEYQFTLKYRKVEGSGDVQFHRRHLFVWPLS